MRVLITNSLVLVAISLAPSASAAPYTTTSSVDSYGSYPNSTALAQDSGPSSVPNVRGDEVIHLQSLHGMGAFGNIFGPVADLFGTIGMNTISNDIPLTEAQKTVLDQLHDALGDAAGSVVAHIPADHPISPLSSRSLEDSQPVNPLAMLHDLPILDTTLAPVLALLEAAKIEANPTAPLTDLQKQVIAKLQTAISNAVGDVTADVPVKLEVLPVGHQPRSVEERSLENVLSLVKGVPALGSALEPVIGVIDSLGATNGTPMDDVQKQILSELEAAIAKAAQNVEARVPTVHTEHTREDREHWDHHDHDPHRDDHHSQDEHKHDDKSWDAHKDDNRSRDAHEDHYKPQDVRKDDHKPHDAHEDDHKPQDVHKDGRKSPDVHKEDRNVQSADREGDHCREPRDGQRGERHKWSDCTHPKDGQGRGEDSSLLKISLGSEHSHHA